ncbi:MAG: hypothetical protein KF861_08160 [Planctomycetaceae bacterium]|nr:hypothetical protein [Planctomycetaceae bacterium]
MSEELKITDSTIAHMSLTRTPDAEQSALMEAFNEEASDVLWRNLVLLCAVDPNSTDQSGTIQVVQGDPIVEIGTGSLYRQGNSAFIITAAHIFSDWESKGYEVRIGVNDRPRPLVPGIEAIAKDESLDVAVAKLTDQAARSLVGNEHLFVNDDFIDSCDYLIEGRYFIAGYLGHRCHSSQDKHSFYLHRYSLWASLTQPPTNANTCFGFWEIPKDPTFIPTSLGTKPAVPTVGGLSGAYVWRIWHDGMDLPADWNGSKVRVVGIQVSESEDRTWLKCVLWKHIMPLIDQLT